MPDMSAMEAQGERSPFMPGPPGKIKAKAKETNKTPTIIQ